MIKYRLVSFFLILLCVLKGKQEEEEQRTQKTKTIELQNTEKSPE